MPKAMPSAATHNGTVEGRIRVNRTQDTKIASGILNGAPRFMKRKIRYSVKTPAAVTTAKTTKMRSPKE